LKGGVIGTKEQTLGFTTVRVPGITTEREKIFLKIILFQIQVPKPFPGVLFKNTSEIHQK
jgi:hypothetical protein